MQQRLSLVKIGYLLGANHMVREIKKLEPVILFQKTEGVSQTILTSFSDASFNINSQKGQAGLTPDIRTKMKDGIDQFYVIKGASTKRKRISHSSYGAEILACAEANDRGYYLKMGMHSLFSKTGIRNEIAVDSIGLFDTI